MHPSKHREKKLEALLNASQILNTSGDTDRILQSLLELSLDLIDGGDAGCIFLYNETTDLLEMYAYVGMGESVKGVKMHPGESMTGIAFLRNEAVFFPDSQVVQAAMATMSRKNTEMAVAGNVVAKEIHSSICCPLLYRDKSLGVLVIDNFSGQVPLKESDVDLLKAISVQATIAIMNARSYERELENNRQLERYNKIIETQRNKYRFTTQVHSKFTDMVLQGSTLDDIIREIKTLSGKEVLIVDLFYNFTHHTFEPSIPPALLEIRPLILQRLKKTAKAVFYEPTTERHYFTFPIMVNQEPMGWLCLVSETIPLSENEIITAERSATILALELLKQNELTDLEQSMKGDFLDCLLAGETSPYLLKGAESYQFDLAAGHQLLLLDFSFGSPLDSDRKNLEKRLRKCIKRYYEPLNAFLNIHFPGSVAVIRRHQLILLLEAPPDRLPGPAEPVLDEIKSQYHRNYSRDFRQLSLAIGISDPFLGIETCRRAFENARQALRMAREDPSPITWRYFKDIEIKRLLLANSPERLSAFRLKTLGPLLNYPHASRRDFIDTLEVYLKSNGSWTLTKEALHIHGNTLTYRLGRIEEILNLDLSHYQDRLRLQIALEIGNLLEPSPESPTA